MICAAGHELIPGSLWTEEDQRAWREEHAACVRTVDVNVEDLPDIVTEARALGFAVLPYENAYASAKTAREAKRIVAALNRGGDVADHAGPLLFWKGLDPWTGKVRAR